MYVGPVLIDGGEQPRQFAESKGEGHREGAAIRKTPSVWRADVDDTYNKDRTDATQGCVDANVRAMWRDCGVQECVCACARMRGFLREHSSSVFPTSVCRL